MSVRFRPQLLAGMEQKTADAISAPATYTISWRYNDEKTTKERTFTVSATIGLETSIEISADSLEAAVAKAGTLQITDFIEILGENNDNVLKISGAYEYIPLNR